MQKPSVGADGFVLSREAHASWYMHGTPFGFFCKPGVAMRYWWNVLGIAFIDACDLAGWGHPKRLPVTIAVAIAPFIAVAVLYSDTTEAKKETMIAVYGLAGVGAIAVLLLLAMIIATPPRLAREAAAATDSERSELVQKIDALTSRLDQRESRRAMNAAIDALLQRGNEACNLLRQADTRGPELETAIDQANKWFAEAEKFVTANYPESIGWYKSDAGLDTATALTGPALRSNYYFGIQRRMTRLQEITSRMTPN